MMILVESNIIVLGLARMNLCVVVNFLSQLIFIFPLLDMVMCANKFKTKEKQKLTITNCNICSMILVTNSYGEYWDPSCEKYWVPVQKQWVPVKKNIYKSVIENAWVFV